jgi:phenylalanyl-tRNA synthetase beta chain
MYLSFDWLSQYVDLSGIEPEQMALDLTMATAEVEGVEILSRSLAGVVAGSVVAVDPIETDDPAKTLASVTVDTGSGTFETVCGAPNVRVGMISAFAAPGTVLSAGTVTEQEVHGRISRGMLCSPLELGWGDSHIGIMSFPAGISPGTPLSDLVPATDAVIEIDNKSITHRPDLWGHYGFSRELAAIYGRELRPLDVADATAWSSLPAFPLKIEDYEGCPGYCCLDVSGIVPAVAPLAIQYRLLAVGLRPISLLVDLTNYLMCELGQPMHAFDGERVRDVIVAPFGGPGTFATLDAIERKMLPTDLMIKDHGGPIAIAGVMGGLNTEITDDTGRVLLESANFHPALIRRTAVRLGLRTDASLRFEKGQPPYHMQVSITRFVRLLELAGQTPEVKSRLTCDGDTGEVPRTMSMDIDSIPRSIGMDIPDERVTGILESLGFGCEATDGRLDLTIPRHRSARDISIPNDIVEEVARIYGYDNIEPAMPKVEMRAYHFNAALERRRKIMRFLSTARGFIEAHTYSWYDDAWLAKISHDPGEALMLQNPASDTATRMRRELLPNLLVLVESNSTHRDEYALYEAGNVFHPDGDGRVQESHLAGTVYRSAKLGSVEDLVRNVRGTVEEVLAISGARDTVFRPMEKPEAPWCKPGMCMDILSDGVVVGSMGFLAGAEFPSFEKDTQVAWFEITLDTLPEETYPEITYEALPVYPGSWMDFSILADAHATYADLDQIVAEFTHPVLRRYRFLYVYSGKGLPQGKVSYSFRFWLGLTDRTLTGDDLTGFRDAFIGYLTKHDLAIR